MANEKEVSGGAEWRVSVPDGSTARLEPDSSPVSRAWLDSKERVSKFGKMVWSIGASDSRKVIHCIKVGIALTLVSLFYYTRPLYDGVGGAAMWAVMTVVVIFEFTVGGCLYKGINRAIATLSAGLLAIGVHWIASKSGDTMEPIIRSASVFILASAATFTKFIPKVKSLFDYGVTIFILTFSLVAVSGYRVDKLISLAQERLLTIAIGIAICFLVAFVIFPVWAGDDLHRLITGNMDKMADSLEGCVDEYFNENQTNDEKVSKSQGYKCVLNSKATEDSLANLAIWEPAHGRFGFGHPWRQYIKIGAAMRCCAYCIEALNGCANSDIQVPDSLKEHLSDVCIRISSDCSQVLKECSASIKSARRSRSKDFLVGKMNVTLQELHDFLKQPSAGTVGVPFLEALPLVTIMSLLIEITSRVESVVSAVDNLATAANFKAASDGKPGRVEPNESP